MLYCGMNAAFRILGIALVTVCLLTVGTVGARFLNTTPAGRLSRRPARPRACKKIWGQSTYLKEISALSPYLLGAAMPVPPSGRRVYAVRQNDNPNSMITMYASSSLSPEQIAEFYLEEMPIYGWREGETEEQELNKHVEDIMLFFRKTGRECVICVGSEGIGAAWTIMMRPVIIGGGG